MGVYGELLLVAKATIIAQESLLTTESFSRCINSAGILLLIFNNRKTSTVKAMLRSPLSQILYTTDIVH